MLVLSVLSSKIIFGFGQVWLSSPDLCLAGIADSAAIPIQEPRSSRNPETVAESLLSDHKKFQWFYFSKMEESAEQ